MGSNYIAGLTLDVWGSFAIAIAIDIIQHTRARHMGAVVG
jgi:hypothetical protein